MFYKLKAISKKTGEATICAVYRDNDGKEFLRSTGVKVAPALFNTKTGKISPKDSDNVEKNEAIAKVARLFETVERNLKQTAPHGHSWQFKSRLEELESVLAEFAETTATTRTVFVSRADTIRNQITRLEKLLDAKKTELEELEAITETGQANKPLHLFSDMLSEFQKHLKNIGRTPSTVKTYTVMGNILNNYRPNIEVEQINLNLLNDIQTHFVKKQTHNSSIEVFFIQFKAAYKWMAEEVNVDTSFLKKFVSFKGQKDKDNICLNKKELAAFQELQIKTKGQHKTRELFLLACHTGLRYSDYIFDRACIQDETYENEKGEWINSKVLLLETLKSGQKIAVPLSEAALEILERNNYQFIRPSEAQFNQALRAIGKKIPELQYDVMTRFKSGTETIQVKKKKYELLSSHVARKTFIDRKFSEGATPMAISQWVGHADTSTLEKHYVNKAELAKREAWKIL